LNKRKNMKYLLGLLLFISVSASAQYSPTAAKTRFVNGIGLGTKDTATMNAADTVAMIVGRDSLVYFRYRGYWKPLAYNSSLTGYIPYTGATSAIDLNAKTVVNISHLGINTTSVPTILLRAISDNNSTSRIAMRGYSSDANSSSIRVTKFRGTVAAPQAPQSGDNLGKFELAGYGTTSSDGYPQATFEALATENWGAIARGAKIQFKVTPNTTTTQALALTINQDKSAVFESSVTGTSIIKTGGTSSQFLKADGSVDANAYLALTGGTMTGQIVLKEATYSSDYSKGLRFPNNPYGGGGDISGLRLYADTIIGLEAQVLELYVSNDSIAPTTDRINFSAPTNNLVTINGNKIWNSGNLPSPQSSITLTTTGTSGAATFTSNTLNIPQYQAAGTYVTSVTGTSPIVSSGGTTPAISIPVATTSVSGYLSSTDWNTFNNKQSALTNPVTGTGTTNYLPKFTGASTIGNSNLINDASGNLGLGVTPSAWGSSYKAIQISAGASFYGINSDSRYAVMGANTYNNNTNDIYIGSGAASLYVQGIGAHQWFTATSGTAGNAISFTQAMTLNASGRLLLNTTSDDGSTTFQVNGTGRFSGNVFVNSVATSGYAFTSVAASWASGSQIYTGIKIGAPADNVNAAGIDLRAYSNYAGSAETEFRLYVNNPSNVLTEALRIASTGAATFSSLAGTGSRIVVADASGTLSATTTAATSGTYTPTITLVSNAASSTARVCQYLRVGSVVTVSGYVTVTATTPAVSSRIYMSLPISSSFTSTAQAGGAGGVPGGANIGTIIFANSTATTVSMDFLPVAGATDYWFTYTYQIL